MQSLLTDNIKPGDIYTRTTQYNAQWCSVKINQLATFIEQQCSSFSPFVYLFASNSIKTVIAYFAIIKAGKIAVIHSPDLGVAEIKEFYSDTPPAAEFRFNTNNDDLDITTELIIHTKREVDITYSELNNVCTMVYTAAMDGHSKAVLLTHKNILSCAQSIARDSQYDHTSICCAALPLDHLFGLQTGVLAPFLGGAKVQIADISTKNNIIQTIKNIGGNQITHLYSVPILLYLFSKFKEHVKNWRTDITITSGSCKLDKSIRDCFKTKYGITLYEGYGLTEASPVCSWQFPDSPVVHDSVGRAIGCCDVRILSDNKLHLNSVIGEIVVRGSNVMNGYYHYADVTKLTIVDDWLRTGDLGTIDRSGNIFLTGLKKRMLNINGRKVYPAEIERFLSTEFGLPVSIVSKENKSELFLKAVVECPLTDPVLSRMKEWCISNLSRDKRPQLFLSKSESV